MGVFHSRAIQSNSINKQQTGEKMTEENSALHKNLTDVVFSWSLRDIFNQDYNRDQVKKIPDSFQSAEHYHASFVHPLLEETRAELSTSLELISRAPFGRVKSIVKDNQSAALLYNVCVVYFKNRSTGGGLDPYRILPGDIFILSDAKLETVSDVQRAERRWAFALVTKVDEINDCFQVRISEDIADGTGVKKWPFMFFLINITTSERVWNALHMFGNQNITKEVLFTDSMVEEKCNLCPESRIGAFTRNLSKISSSNLNKSQMEAIVACLAKIQCDHKSSIELIRGPPGTGKTRTVSVLLFCLLGTNNRSITCAPTAVAVLEVASCVLRHVKELFESNPRKDDLACSFGDILLFGDYNAAEVGSDIKNIYLDHRVERLAECFDPKNGWKQSFNSMIVFLEDGVSEYHISQGELYTEEECNKKGESRSFLQFARYRFKSIALLLRGAVTTLFTHIPKSFILEHNLQAMYSLLDLLGSFESLLHGNNMVSEELERLFSLKEEVMDSSKSLENLSTLMQVRSECLNVLKTVGHTLDGLGFPEDTSKDSIIDFCFRTASSMFCTASDSYKLHLVDMKPVNILVIDEAAQLKESESIIPLKLPGIKFALLIGDEFQLPSVVKSDISYEAGFGRSLYERLSSIGHVKHFLNMQYRMHPLISFFPSSKFYANGILNAPIVTLKTYEKEYLPKPTFAAYSFINISFGREEVDELGHSVKNMVEVAVVMKIVQNLYEAWSSGFKQKLRIGVISPFTAQVLEIQEKLDQNYENNDKFAVKVDTIDGFQGGEGDIILISTVRANSAGSVGVLADLKRTNVALTRARQCLWILGNERTLVNSETIWKDIVYDAKDRQCFSNAEGDCDLSSAIFKVKAELDQLDDFLDEDSSLFKFARWKVIFSQNFRNAFISQKSSTKKMAMTLLLRLSTGWRPKRSYKDLTCERSSHIVKQFKVGGVYIVCSNDLTNEWSCCTQVLKVWDMLPSKDIPELVKHLDSIFEMYTDEYLSHCKAKCLQGKLEVPMSWETSYDIIQYKRPSTSATSGISNHVDLAKSNVSESFLIMKFYSLSCVMVQHLLTRDNGRDLDLPFELTYQEQEIILFNRSTFVLGRSGTGKTTVLTMKLFQREQLSHIASEGLFEVKGSLSSHDGHRSEVSECGGNMKGEFLRQIFVTVSPRLCNAIRQQLSNFQSFACDGEFHPESNSFNLDDIDDTAQFKDIPDSFLNIPSKSFPLVITFHKFLMMLDGTVGRSYFLRFPDARQLSRTVTLQTLIRSKEVNYERFASSYWPHFNSVLRKNLDSSAVFTEIISHIKGGLGAGDTHDGKLSREDYLLLSKHRVSTLTREQRDAVYDIFLQYEKKKTGKAEYDLSDLVLDLHCRLRNERYEGDQMDFVYIDEVQDLTMRQIALFKYICRNMDEGFVFSGDTAQTIAKGVDFRFEDIRHLFFKEFLLGSRIDGTDERRQKGKMSKIYHLSQNFRTHAGVLNLAQSLIDLLYHFFPLSIDVLNPETSLINGEAPVLIESESYKDALVTIFENSVKIDVNVGFGAEQVILVRNDSAKKEICKYVANKALVLTIFECKGLEFKDVLLCNFFGSSPLKHHWRVVYHFMNEKNLVDSKPSISIPCFDEAKDNVLCSELKQLYVAITRTRQRFWICENKDEVSQPIFEYWEKLSLIKVKHLKDVVARGMQVASSRDEWRSRGLKLFYEHNYEMARMCFEKSGDKDNEKFAKAAELYASANRMYGSDPRLASDYFHNAAGIFGAIGKAEFAAECFFKMKNYEKAGKFYIEKCGEPKLDKSGECFALAGCYKRAAEAYASGNLFSECLAVCIKGKLFDMGFQFIKQWKHNTTDACLVKRTEDTLNIEEDFLEKGAVHSHKLKDKYAMLKFVRAFHSMDKRRTFLKNLGLLDELLLLEEEFGNYLEAANIAKLKGDVPREANLLEKAGHIREASMIILCYVFSKTQSTPGSKSCLWGQFTQKDLLTHAKLIARKHSELFYTFICNGADMLSDVNNIWEDFLLGLQFVQYWKKNAPKDVAIEQSCGMHNAEQNLLRKCARHYHKLKDKAAMMKCVEAFHPIGSIRTFLKDLSCFDELLIFEIEKGNFLEAANAAKLKGDFLHQADLLVIAGYFREASMIILLYVFTNFFYAFESKFSRLKQFAVKDDLLAKAKSFAKNYSDTFYYFVCEGAKMMSDGEDNGKNFFLSLEFVQYWKQKAPTDVLMDEENEEIDRIEQVLLERCARHYQELKDITAMMKYVKSFHSIWLMRTFLKNSGYLKELLSIEEENGNLVEAANIAKWIGDISVEVKMLVKAEKFYDSSTAILQYVLIKSLWQPGSEGWPLKQFMEKDNLLKRAVVNAPKNFYELISTEAKILSHEQSSLLELNEYFKSSRNHGSIRGEILTARKIIDTYIHLIRTSADMLKYDLFANLTPCSEEVISIGRCSLKTWIYFWNFWKDKVVNIFECLGCFGVEAVRKKYVDYEEFCLNYFGVTKLCLNRRTVYHVLNPEADWVRKIDDRFLCRNGKLFLLDATQFVYAAKCYWSSELLSLGIKVLENLEALHRFAISNSCSLFFQSIPLLYIFDLTKSLMETPFWDSRHPHAETLQVFRKISTERFLGNIYSLDCRKSSTEDMISLRETDLARNVLREVISRNALLKGKLTYGQIGRSVMIMFGLGGLTDDIAKSFNSFSPWRGLVEELGAIKRSELSCQSSYAERNNAAKKELSLILMLREALEDTCSANWREETDFMSPVSFLHLIERLLLLASYCQGYIFTTKAVVVEWLIFRQWNTVPSGCLQNDACASEKTQILGDTFNSIAHIVHELLCDQVGTLEWIEKSNIDLKEYSVLVLRLVVIMCLVCVNSGRHFDLLFDLLGRTKITSQLPETFCAAFLGREECSFVDVLAQALKHIESILVILSWGNNYLSFSQDAISVDDMANQNRESLLRALFQKKDHATASDLHSSNSSAAEQNLNDLQGNYNRFRELFDPSKSFENGNDMEAESTILKAPWIKDLVDKSIDPIVSAMTQYFQMVPCNSQDGKLPQDSNCEDGNLLWEANRMLDDFKQLSHLLDDSSLSSRKKKTSEKIQRLLNKLQRRKAKLEPFLRRVWLQNETTVVHIADDSSR